MMKTYIKILTIIFLLTLSSIALCQEGELFLLGDTISVDKSKQISIVYLEDFIIKGLVVKNDINNFTYQGRIIDKDKKEYITFLSYSESVGSTKYYLFDLEKKGMYVSQAVQEYEVPFIFSFNKNTLSMNVISFDPPNCGKIRQLAFVREEMRSFDLDTIQRLKVYTIIDL